MSQETKNTTEQDLPVEETAQQPPETGEPVRSRNRRRSPQKNLQRKKNSRQSWTASSSSLQRSMTATFVWRRNMTISASAARRKKTSSTP